MARKRHKTPKRLDKFFQRAVVDREDYQDFWSRWWSANESERKEIIEELTEEKTEQELHEPTRDYEEAKRRAKELGGWIVRRGADGRFNKRGRTYQAVTRKKK